MLFCFSSCGGLPAIPGVPWLVNTSLCLNLHLHTAFSLLCLGPDFLLLLRTRVTGLGFTLIQYDLILITSAKTLFPKEVIFTSVPGVRISDHTVPRNMSSLHVLREQGCVGPVMGQSLYCSHQFVSEHQFIKASAPGQRL